MLDLLLRALTQLLVVVLLAAALAIPGLLLVLLLRLFRKVRGEPEEVKQRRLMLQRERESARRVSEAMAREFAARGPSPTRREETERVQEVAPQLAEVLARGRPAGVLRTWRLFEAGDGLPVSLEVSAYAVAGKEEPVLLGRLSHGPGALAISFAKRDFLISDTEERCTWSYGSGLKVFPAGDFAEQVKAPSPLAAQAEPTDFYPERWTVSFREDHSHERFNTSVGDAIEVSLIIDLDLRTAIVVVLRTLDVSN